ncbi:odorant receptor 4-like [Linepithema humile]|uniref:odorant receptor 4-like n=1 Tax=Linepithema humile TaxID=83485 RepID=UPI00351E0FDB
MEDTWNHYYNILFKISSITGAWPYLKLRTKIFRVTLRTTITLTILIPQLAYQFKCKKDMQCTFKAMTAYLLSFIAMLKVYTIQSNTRTIKNFIQHLLGYWKELQTSEEYEIMKSYAENSRRFSLVYTIYCFIAVIVFVLMSLIPYALDIVLPLNESRPFLPPYQGYYYFVDMQDYFFETISHGIVAWTVTVAGLVVHDCMFVTFVEHVCSMFAVVGFRYEQLLFNRNEEMKDVNNSSEISHKKIAFFVHTHREALKYAQLLENTFTTPFAIQMLIVTIEMSISLLQIAQGNEDTLEALRYIFYVFGQLIHLFFLSFEGQKLIDHSLQIRDKIYNSCWYSASIKLQKLIIFVMMKSLQPSFLSAGKIYILSLKSFTTVLQTSMSYLTVLTSMQ